MGLFKLTNRVLLPTRRYLSTSTHSSGQTKDFKGKWIKSVDKDPNVLSSILDFEPTKEITIPEFLRLNIHKWEHAPALTCAISGRTYTHGQVHRKSQNFAAALLEHGLKRGESVCILLPNMPEYAIAALGVWEAGLVVSPINPAYTVDEVDAQVRNCGGKVIITIPELLPLAQKVQNGSDSGVKSIIVIGDPGGHHSFFDMLNVDCKGARLIRGTEINTLQETALLPYSSGTTGPPKGVELTHSTFSTNLLQALSPDYRQTTYFDGTNEQERFLAVLPFFHMYGLQFVMASALHHGAHALCFPKFDPVSYTKGLKEHKPTLLHLVTPLIAFILHSKDITPQDLIQVRGTVAGGAPTGKTLIDFYVNKFDHYMCYQEAYGMTEISSGSHMVPAITKNSKSGSGGVLLPGTSAKIASVESGLTLGPNEAGEICVKGPQIMKGYYRNEKATQEAKDSHGFLRTGDIGYHDEEGFLYVVDRLKELIKVKGLQVAPAELENILRKHEEIADVAVIGVPHDKLGEAPRAYIVPKSKTLSESSVSQFLDGRVSSHKKLVGGVEFVEAIPKAPSGKILRRVLKDLYKAK